MPANTSPRFVEEGHSLKPLRDRSIDLLTRGSSKPCTAAILEGV